MISEGGVQVYAAVERFRDEGRGYSEAARAVLAQPGGVAWTIFDARIAAVARRFEDFRRAEAAGAIRSAATPGALAAALGRDDRFGRRFDGPPLAPQVLGVKVTGALFHSQGGLEVDAAARVRRVRGGTFPNLHAVGGAACGVSGNGDAGYLSGNGLLAAVALGRLAGRVPVDRPRPGPAAGPGSRRASACAAQREEAAAAADDGRERPVPATLGRFAR